MQRPLRASAQARTSSPSIEGRSWCEQCLPERDDEVTPEPATQPIIDLPFDINAPITGIEEGLHYVSAMVCLHVGNDPSAPAMAAVYLDADEQPIGIGLNRDFIERGEWDVINELGALVVQLMAAVRGQPSRMMEAWTQVQVLRLGVE